MSLGNQIAIFAATLGLVSAAHASPVFNVLFSPSAGFTAADESQIQNAINFYAADMTNNFTVTIAFGSQAGGGGSSLWFGDIVSYNDYYSALVANSSGGATDTSAIASLGGGTHTNNPVTGSSEVTMTSTLASNLGLGGQVSSSFAACGGLSANACVVLGTDFLTGGPGGTPSAGLFGTVQHEVDEALGTASALPNGGGSLPADPSVADLYRYTAPGTRSFALNTSTDVPCTGSPTAYLSVDGGTTNLNPYNNCNNGGDYGDWNFSDGLQVQDAFGPTDAPSSLSLGSPEVALLDAVGYNFTTPTATPEPRTLLVLVLFAGILVAAHQRHRRRV
ncbi:MAG TPA: NF038122 family metalloprotease [Bryobacteraceae bacterium]|nr:NF038122 family metalloprotease [Bryobacteraceae bacterium]